MGNQIKQATQEAFMPHALRVEFGDALAIEISKAYKIVDKNGRSAQLVYIGVAASGHR